MLHWFLSVSFELWFENVLLKKAKPSMKKTMSDIALKLSFIGSLTVPHVRIFSHLNLNFINKYYPKVLFTL